MKRLAPFFAKCRICGKRRWLCTICGGVCKACHVVGMLKEVKP
jgi:hypothetical protein